MILRIAYERDGEPSDKDSANSVVAFLTSSETLYLADKEHFFSKYYKKRVGFWSQRLVGVYANINDFVSRYAGEPVNSPTFYREGDELKARFCRADSMAFVSQNAMPIIQGIIELAEKEANPSFSGEKDV